MPNITKRLLSDQLLFKLDGSFPEVSMAVQKQDVWKAIEQWINSKFKLKHFQETLPTGETIPEGASLATYTGIAVTSSGDKSVCTLPVMPISLPRNMGVYDINDGNGYSFIPLQKGQINLLGQEFLANTLLGQICYEIAGMNVTFSQDITLLKMDTVNMDLMVFDMSKYSETDILPLPSDMEQQLLDDLYKMFAPIQPEPATVSNYPVNSQKQ
jgi:hypothetical protein